MTFNDDNTLGDIQGLLYCLVADVVAENPEFAVGPRLDELIARIKEKLSRNTNRTKANWFGIALDRAEEAKNCFESTRTPEAKAALRECLEYLEGGNKAHRRKVTFIVTPEGTVIPVTRNKRTA